MISINCFKKICQLTKCIKGNEVREYFIQVESLLNNKSLYINSSSSSKNYVYSKTGGTEFILTKMIEENLL